MMKRISQMILGLLVLCSTAMAQDKKQSVYDPYALFSPNFYEQAENYTRTADGRPSKQYWQNKVDYKIDAALNEQTNVISATVNVTYYNYSPHDLEFLWLMLDQNLFSKGSRGQDRMPVGQRSRYGDASSNFDGGFKLKKVTLGNEVISNYVVTDTRMQIKLKAPLVAKKGVVTFSIDYSFTLPQYGADRCGILKTKNGDIYAVAQWYPRMCVYDDVLGWNTNPYLGPSEFYCDYGNFDVSITAPSNHIVVASGALLNEKEALSAEEFANLQKAKTSNSTVDIRSQAKVESMAAAPNATTTKTWKYRMINSRDFAWGSSKAFIWDAAKMNLPNGKVGLAQSVYPVESAGEKAWGRSTEYTKASIENYSNRWYPYPYPVATNVASNIGGMEYPGIVFCGSGAKTAGLWGVTDHEFGHTWFPMIVGSNERKFGWMDEGFNTFINSIAEQDFNKGEYYSKGNNASAVYMFGKNSEPIMSTPDALAERNIGTDLYSKPGLGLTLLRDYVVGAERFDFAFRQYIKNWAYKHPTPTDFFKSMDNGTGEDLTWFWRGWFYENFKIDQAIDKVEYPKDDATKGAIVSLVNLEQLAMPVVITWETTSGAKGMRKLPVEIWNNTSNFKVMIDSKETLKWVKLDEEKMLPDVDRKNNEWMGGDK